MNAENADKKTPLLMLLSKNPRISVQKTKCQVARNNPLYRDK